VRGRRTSAMVSEPDAPRPQAEDSRRPEVIALHRRRPHEGRTGSRRRAVPRCEWPAPPSLGHRHRSRVLVGGRSTSGRDQRTGRNAARRGGRRRQWNNTKAPPGGGQGRATADALLGERLGTVARAGRAEVLRRGARRRGGSRLGRRAIKGVPAAKASVPAPVEALTNEHGAQSTVGAAKRGHSRVSGAAEAPRARSRLASERARGESSSGRPTYVSVRRGPWSRRRLGRRAAGRAGPCATRPGDRRRSAGASASGVWARRLARGRRRWGWIR